MTRLIFTAFAVSLGLCISVGCHKNVIFNPAGTQPSPGNANPQQNGPILFNGPTFPPPETGSVGDFYIDVSSGTLYGPKSALGWGLGSTLPDYGEQVQLYSGGVAPNAYTAYPGDYYLDLSNDELFGPKVGYIWGPGRVLASVGSTSDSVQVK